MIQLHGLTKSFTASGQKKFVTRSVDAVFKPGVSTGLLGRNGAGKSTLLSMIAGNISPTSGKITSSGSISWTVGFAGSFHGELTGAQNTRFVARIYGIDTDEMISFVESFAELGPHFHMPFRSYSAGMKSRLAFGVSMAVPFDTYLVDEVTSVGDALFKQKSAEVFSLRMQRAGAIVVSHSMDQIRQMCSAGAVLENGKLTMFDDIEDAIAFHNHNMKSNRV